MEIWRTCNLIEQFARGAIECPNFHQPSIIGMNSTKRKTR